MSLFQVPWSIGRIVRKEESDWRSYNEVRKRYKLSLLQRELLFAGEHPFRFCVSLLALLLLAFALSYAMEAIPLELIWSTLKEDEQLSYFSTLLTTQATLAALVYPIVIAFVTLFVQKRPGAQAFVNLYILDSGALVAGLSSVMLVIAMGAQYLLLSLYAKSSLGVWLALDSVWFLLNTSLTAIFLYRTIEFLRPDRQMQVVRRYIASVALPREIARIYGYHVLLHAQNKDWVPGKGPDDFSVKQPTVLFNSLFANEGTSQATRILKERHVLHDIRLWPLRILTASWLRRAKSAQGNGVIPASNSRAPLLTVPLVPGRVYEGATTLARVSAGPNLDVLENWLLRRALIFKRDKRSRSGIRLPAILGELEADAREAALSGSNEDFNRTYDAFVEIHLLLLEASLVKSDDGTVTSWGIFADPQSFFEGKLHTSWSGVYRSIFQAAVQSISRDVWPIQRLCHLAQRLSGTGLKSSPLELQQEVMHLPPQMMHLLSSWWKRQLGEQGVFEHDYNHSAVLRPPLQQTYKEVIATFMAGWEHTRTGAVDWLSASTPFDPTELPSVALAATHITETGRMLVGAVKRGDREAAEWLADVLSKWWTPFRYEDAAINVSHRATFVTLDDLGKEWPALFSLVGLNDQKQHSDSSESSKIRRDIVVSALRNFLTDIRLLTAEFLLMFVDPAEKSSLARDIAVGLLVGQQWRSGGSATPALAQTSAPEYLSAKVRQMGGDESASRYRSRLDQFVERIRDTHHEDMISSRTYMRVGARDIESLRDSQLALLATLSRTAWVPGDSLKRAIDQWSVGEPNTIETLKYRVQHWLDRIGPDTSPPALVATLLPPLKTSHTAEIGWIRAGDGLRSLVAYLDEQRTQVLTAEPVDPARLLEIAQYASATAFGSEPLHFPLSLFAQVLHTDEALGDFTSETEVGKDEVIRAAVAQRSEGGGEYWSEVMEDEVSVVLLSDVVRGCAVKDVQANDADAYWQALIAEAQLIQTFGGNPVLILWNRTEPDWVYDWQNPTGYEKHLAPAELQLRRVECADPDYLCHFNEIALYAGRLPPGQSLLIAKEAFDQVKFQEFSSGRLVDASTTPVEGNALKVDLALRFSRSVVVGLNYAVRLRHA